MKRVVFIIVIDLILVLAGLEVMLRIFDPWGALAYHESVNAWNQTLEGDGNRYIMRPGDYEFNGWQATISEENTRHVPDTIESDCRIAFLGDSVTFGMSVDDNEAWVNLVAQDIDAHVINAGMIGYNSEDVYDTMRAVDADAYVYVIVENDRQPRQYIRNVDLTAATLVYGSHVRLRISGTGSASQVGAAVGPVIETPDRFLADVSNIRAYGDVLILGFENSQLAEITADHLIPQFDSIVSVTDSHADKTGNQQIAEAALPLVQEFVAAQCNE